MAVPGGPTFRRVSLLRLLVIVLVVTLAPLAARGAVDISTEGRNINVSAPAQSATTSGPPPAAAPAPPTPGSLGGSSRSDAATTSSTSSTTSTTVAETTTSAPPETTTTTAAPPPSTAPPTTQSEHYAVLQQRAGSQEAVEQLVEVVEQVNERRADAGCSPLDVDDRLVAAAQGHSEDMSARGYMDHTNPDGQDPGDRAADAGYDGPVGENIAQGYTSADAVMDAWMDSDGHRANIENCAYTIIGVGLATDGWYWTQVFGQ